MNSFGITGASGVLVACKVVDAAVTGALQHDFAAHPGRQLRCSGMCHLCADRQRHLCEHNCNFVQFLMTVVHSSSKHCDVQRIVKNPSRSILICLNIDQNDGMRKIPRAEARAWWLSFGLAGSEGRFDPSQFSGTLRKSLTFLGHLAIQTRRRSLPPYYIV